MSAFITKERIDIQAFIADKDVNQEAANLLGISRSLAKRVRHGIRYGMGFDTLKEYLNLPTAEVLKIKDMFEDSQTLNYAKDIQKEEYAKSPIYKRVIRFSEVKSYTNFNWLIQGSCVDLLLKCLDLAKRIENDWQALIEKTFNFLVISMTAFT